MASWGDSAEWFNYLLFDYLPGYNKFRSVTFLMILPLFAFPLLGMLGLEKLFTNGIDKDARKKLLIVLGATGGLCVLLLLFGGMMSFMSAQESQLPSWFTSALADDRKSLFRSDVFRSLAFIIAAFVVIYFEVWKKISPIAFYAFLIIMITLDLAIVDKRYFGKDKYQRKRENTMFAMNAADQEILKDKSHYRVYNLQGTFEEARTSYFHNSIGGYHGVKMRRYQDLYDTCLFRETNEFIQDVQSGKADFSKYGVMNMLNVKYVVFGPERNNIIPNPAANGNGWFVSEVVTVNSPTEEVLKTCGINTRTTAVVDASRFKVEPVQADTAASLTLVDRNPNYQKYESQSQANGLAVFSEIYYPNGWKAFVDGKETEIICADYVLRAVQVPAGKHVVEFKFEPAAYYTGNKITMISSWLMLVALLGSVVWSVRKEEA
jgi:ABC-type multidrug transport system fused ATPase/permease subunit